MTVRLFNTDGVGVVRATRAAADAPNWSPDAPAGEAFDDIVFEGYDWTTVRIMPIFGGVPGGGESVEIEPIVEVRDPANPIDAAAGRTWGALPRTSLSHEQVSDIIEVHGRRAAFRITALALGATPSVTLRIISGDMEQRGSF